MSIASDAWQCYFFVDTTSTSSISSLVVWLFLHELTSSEDALYLLGGFERAHGSSGYRNHFSLCLYYYLIVKDIKEHWRVAFLEAVMRNIFRLELFLRSAMGKLQGIIRADHSFLSLNSLSTIFVPVAISVRGYTNVARCCRHTHDAPTTACVQTSTGRRITWSDSSGRRHFILAHKQTSKLPSFPKLSSLHETLGILNELVLQSIKVLVEAILGGDKREVKGDAIECTIPGLAGCHVATGRSAIPLSLSLLSRRSFFARDRGA